MNNEQKVGEVEHKFPVPTREELLVVIEKFNTPVNRDQLFVKLGLTREEEYEGLRRRLKAMERDGQLVYTRKHCYALPEKLDLVKGHVIGHKDGFGFLHPDNSIGKKDDLVIPIHQMRQLLHGDYVLVQPVENTKRGRKECRIVRVLEKRKSQIVGRFFVEQGNAFVVPDDSRINHDILIAPEYKMDARMGNVVVVELLERGTRKSNFKGKITEVLGENMAPGMEIEIALRTFDIPHVWPEKVKEQIAQLEENIPAELYESRVDLRDLPLVTIDGSDARDFDDAVYCKSLNEKGWKLWVAIADVSYYVRPKTPLDNEAIKRGNSVYFPEKVIPMLPEILSNGACSLNPQVDRLCMVCEMSVSAKGKLTGYKHYAAIMNSHARLTYNKVAKILEGDSELCERYAPLVADLTELHQLYSALNRARKRRGAVEFETIESKFIFNEYRKIDRIEPVVRNDAHKMIEECMILANVASAQFVEKHKEAALYRVHEKPGEAKLVAFRDFLGELGLNLNGGLEPSPKDYATLALLIQDRPDKELIQTMLLRSMKQAVYQADNQGHFGLALTQYAHFTSPIRRYPDLVLHRVIKSILAKQASDKALARKIYVGSTSYASEQIDALGESCSTSERRADEATRDVADWLKCEYMQDHVGDELDGVIANVTGFGFFVRLVDLHIDGLVHISNLENDYYNFDGAHQRLVGESSGKIYKLGDKIVIKVMAVNLQDRQIDFALVENNQGKQEKPRKKKSFYKNKKKDISATKKSHSTKKKPTTSKRKPTTSKKKKVTRKKK